jgi:hypothetical protein
VSGMRTFLLILIAAPIGAVNSFTGLRRLLQIRPMTGGMECGHGQCNARTPRARLNPASHIR